MDIYILICISTICIMLVLKKTGERKKLRDIEKKKKILLKIYMCSWIIISALAGFYTYYTITHSRFADNVKYTIVFDSIAIVMGYIYVVMILVLTKIDNKNDDIDGIRCKKQNK